MPKRRPFSNKKINDAKYLLANTDLNFTEIGKIVRLNKTTIRNLDYAHDLREVDFSRETANKRSQSNSAKARQKRKKKELNKFTEDQKNKLIKNNYRLFVFIVNRFYGQNLQRFRRLGLEEEDILQDFILHSMERLNLYKSNYKFSTFIGQLFRNFIKSTINARQ